MCCLCCLRVLLPSRRAVFEEPRSFIYSLCVAGDVVLSGSGDGMLLAHDLQHAGGSGGKHGAATGGLLWGLGASSAGAVRAVGASDRRIVAAGDDGNVLVFVME